MARRVHQILATLGYGDAIGHEVLGIARALRAAGFDSEIIVETADPRLEDLDRRLPRHDRRDRGRRPADPSFLARIARLAHRLRAARADGAHLPQHHAAGVLPRRARSARAAVLHGRRELLRVPIARRSRARRFGVQPPGARGRRASRRRRCCRSCRAFVISRSRRTPRVLDAFDDEWTNVLFVGRVVPNKRPDDLIRYFHAYKTLFNRHARLHHRRVVRRIRRVPRAAASARRAAGRGRCPHPRTGDERRADGALRRRGSVPLRQRARRLLRAADRIVLQARAGARLRGHGRAGDDGRRRRAVRHARSAAGRYADAGHAVRRRSRGPRGRGAGRGARAAARAGFRRHDRAVRQRRAREPAASAGARRLRLLAAVQARRRARGDSAVPPRGVPRAAVRARRAVADVGPASRHGSTDDRQPVGARGAPRRRDRRQRPRGARRAAIVGARVGDLRAHDRRRARGRDPAVARRRGARRATSRCSTSRCRRR